MLFPTIEFTILFLICFLSTSFIKNSINKLNIIIIFNVLFYIAPTIYNVSNFNDFIYQNSSFIYLIFWSFLIYIAGKTKDFRLFVLFFAVFQLIYWKAIDVGFICFKPFITPLGISFFTFQGLTYLFARMGLPKHLPNEHIEENWSFNKIFAFIGFFPTVLSGPIMRAKNWEYNLHTIKPLSNKNFNYALLLIVIGCFYKLCISSYLHDIVTSAWSDPQNEKLSTLIIGFFSYSFEIYHDFAGYSLMAIGIGLLLGFVIPQNFNQPYLSINIQEFWRNWHISFSSWLRDYIYISLLGGSRLSKVRHLINIILLMLICGLWHGISLNYIIWGLWNGVGMVIYNLIKDSIKINKYLAILMTFLFVSIGWLFFRAPDLTTALDYINRFFNLIAWENIEFSLKDIFILAFFPILLFIQIIEKKLLKNIEFKSIIFNKNISFLTWGLLLLLILVVSPSGMPPFIYFSY